MCLLNKLFPHKCLLDLSLLTPIGLDWTDLVVGQGPKPNTDCPLFSDCEALYHNIEDYNVYMYIVFKIICFSLEASGRLNWTTWVWS